MTGEPQGLGLLITALAFALFLALRGRSRRARTARSLNRALHELRRPLQALALGAPAGQAVGDPVRAESGFLRVVSGASLHDPVKQAMRALAELDRAINGGPVAKSRSELVAVKLMADACVRRWLPRARLAGSDLSLRWSGQDVLVRGDGLALAGALENLILNAIEHGGNRIEVWGSTDGRSVTLSVVDSGRSGLPPLGEHRGERSGGDRHGHGLEIVDETARGHGGRLDVVLDPNGSRAALILPLARVGSVAGRRVRVNW